MEGKRRRAVQAIVPTVQQAVDTSVTRVQQVLSQATAIVISTVIHMVMNTRLRGSSFAIYNSVNRSNFKGEYVYREHLMVMEKYHFFGACRMRPVAFCALVKFLERYATVQIEESDFVSAQQSLFITLTILGSGASYREIQGRFGHSKETISRHHKNVLRSLIAVHQHYVKSPDANTTSTFPHKPYLDKAFKDCLGAIDGCLVKVYITNTKDAVPWTDRYSDKTQNVFAAVDHEGRFLHVYPGTPGSTHDSACYRFAKAAGFSIPAGKFYLADDGFFMDDGVLIPYTRTRYHLKVWSRGQGEIQSPREAFNYHHASLRTIVEQAFGIMQSRWRIIQYRAPEGYSLEMQTAIIFIITGLQNFLVTEDPLEPLPPEYYKLKDIAANKAKRIDEERRKKEKKEAENKRKGKKRQRSPSVEPVEDPRDCLTREERISQL